MGERISSGVQWCTLVVLFLQKVGYRLHSYNIVKLYEHVMLLFSTYNSTPVCWSCWCQLFSACCPSTPQCRTKHWPDAVNTESPQIVKVKHQVHPKFWWRQTTEDLMPTTNLNSTTNPNAAIFSLFYSLILNKYFLRTSFINQESGSELQCMFFLHFIWPLWPSPESSIRPFKVFTALSIIFFCVTVLPWDSKLPSLSSQNNFCPYLPAKWPKGLVSPWW